MPPCPHQRPSSAPLLIWHQAWPHLHLVFRAVGHHSKPEVLAWLEREGLR